jgi:transposase
MGRNLSIKSLYSTIYQIRSIYGLFFSFPAGRSFKIPPMRRNRARRLKLKDLDFAVAGLNLVIKLLTAFWVPKAPLVLRVIDILSRILSILKACQPIADSTNSNKPASNEFNTAKPKRNKGKKKRGGQKGHPGVTLRQVPDPDVVVHLIGDIDTYLNNPGRYVRVGEPEVRQVFGMEAKRVVTEYRNDTFLDTETGKIITGEFPEEAKTYVQYGTAVEVVAVELNVANAVPFQKTADIINGLTGYNVSPATVCNMVARLAESTALMSFENAAKKDLIECECMGCDETGGSNEGQNHWFHLMQNKTITWLTHHKKRGKEAMDDIGVLPLFTGKLVHDFWQAYFSYTDIEHCMCNAHIVRELNNAIDMKQNWAVPMRRLLLALDRIKTICDGVVPLDIQRKALRKYKAILESGYNETGGKILVRTRNCKKRGRIAKPKYRNLLERMDNYRIEILRFMADKEIPWSNNDTERVIRPFKVHVKVSGCFRSNDYVGQYCRMYSYIASCRKKGIKSFEAIKMAIDGIFPEFVQKILGGDPKFDDNNKAA